MSTLINMPLTQAEISFIAICLIIAITGIIGTFAYLKDVESGAINNDNEDEENYL